MSDVRPLEEVLTLALKLPPGDRLQLVEGVIASVKQEIAAPATSPTSTTEGHWGKALLQMLEELDFTGWTDIDTDDPVEWVKRVRQEQVIRRGLDWGQE